MKKLNHIGIFLVCLFITIQSFASEPIRVACIGNSITYGAFIPNREMNCYPAQLQAYLGDGYEVKNFGASGRTILSKGDYPYSETDTYKASLEYQPDIVLIKLGTNDTKPQNWKYKNEFKDNYQTLIDTYRNLKSHPRIILLTPIRCFLPEGSEINAQLIENEVRPTVEELAWKNQLEIINLFNLFGDQWDSVMLPDKLHPSSIGAGVMAQKIYEYLAVKATASPTKLQTSLGIQDAKRFNFHGHQGYEFENEGVKCLVVEPAKEAIGKPWMIRARFWGHEPQTDIALLEHGFHIVYCDVADLYGSDKAVQRWNSFYKRMVKAGFNKKVALEGMSRGGLIVYNWAAQNPEKVACIYADAPVMDFKSWPMGQGKSAGSTMDTKQLLNAYGFKNEAEALNWKKNPIDCAPTMAKAGIPILHVVGDADQVVSVAENTAIFEQRMEELHAPITIIHKPGVDHHPHSLNNPEPIVQFILKATNRAENMCVHPVPGNEFRSAAGWTQNSDWNSVAKDITTTLNGKHLKLLLLGNSITQDWGGNRKEVTYKPGKEALAMIEESYPHIVISDIMMPEMNGLELCKRIKENQNYCHIPVILLTAKSMISQIEEGLDAGADDYIVKPFQISLLKARIRNLLSLHEKMKTMYGETFSLKQFGVEEPKEHDDFLTRYIEIVKANISNPELDVSVIYEALGMSRTNFYRKVKTVTGLSPIELIKNIRLEAGAKLLKESDMNISEIAQHIGFSSRSYFARSFKAVYGMSPTEYQETKSQD